jgi:hypothetical protein
MSIFRFSRRLQIVLFTVVAFAQQSGGPQNSIFEGQPAMTLTNDKVQFTVMVKGSAIASAVMNDDAGKPSPLWNPLKLARDKGGRLSTLGTIGHLVCIDGFGQPSADERAVGIPQHSEAHITKLNVVTLEKNGATNTVSLWATLPIVRGVA